MIRAKVLIGEVLASSFGPVGLVLSRMVEV